MTTETFGTAGALRVDVPRHGRDGRPLILLPQFAPNPELATILRIRPDDRSAAQKRAVKGKTGYYSRASSFGKLIESTKALEMWGQRMVAVGLALRDDLLLNVKAHAHDPAGNKTVIGEACEQAIEAAKASEKANTGTALHKLTELVDQGVPLPPLPEATQRDLAAYRACMAREGVVHKRTEQFVVCDELGVAGSFDRFMTVAVVPGVTYVGDIKTGNTAKDRAGNIERDEAGRPVLAYITAVAVQLGVYANSELYDPATGARTPLDVHKGAAIVIHLPQSLGSCELHWLDIGAGYEGAKLAHAARAWQSRRDLAVPFTRAAA